MESLCLDLSDQMNCRRAVEGAREVYNLAADILSLRKLPFENMDAWLEKMLEMEKKKK